MSEAKHLETLLTEPQPEAKAAMAEMRVQGLSLMQIVSLLMQYGPQVLAVFANAGKYLTWIQAVVAAIRNGQPLPPLPS